MKYIIVLMRDFLNISSLNKTTTIPNAIAIIPILELNKTLYTEKKVITNVFITNAFFLDFKM